MVGLLLCDFLRGRFVGNDTGRLFQDYETKIRRGSSGFQDDAFAPSFSKTGSCRNQRFDTKTVASCAGVEDRRSLLDCLHHACSHYDSDAENAIERVLKWKRKKEL